ncbi:MAG: acyltransferase [Eubacterium sp.]|nr:acyltransferase [Eubacterium sp.]
MKRNYGLDIIKLLAIIMVVITHSYIGKEYSNYFVFPYLIEIAVPVFLVVSAYLNTASLDRGGVQKYYLFDNMTRRVARILLPFLIVVIFEIIWCLTHGDGFSVILKKLVFGLWGDGGYYPYILIQFTFIFPFIYRATKKTTGFCTIILLNVLFEAFTSFGFIPELVHRICILRYFGIIVSGILLYRYYAWFTVKRTAVIGIVGAIIVGLNYYTFIFRNIFRYWYSTCILCSAYTVALVACTLMIKCDRNKLIETLSKLGKATYQICLFQMLWFFVIRHSDSIMEPFVLVSIVCCIGVGFVWYMFDERIQRRIFDRNIVNK